MESSCAYTLMGQPAQEDPGWDVIFLRMRRLWSSDAWAQEDHVTAIR
jgi:hypothetical protein